MLWPLALEAHAHLAHHPIDVHVGARVRQRRILLGMTQTALGKAVGLTFQQVQKYENGGNRISSSRLFEFAKILNVPVSYFFDEMAPGLATGRRKGGRQKSNASDEANVKLKRETFELVRAYYKIRNDGVRQTIRVMVQALASKG
jgi:transcriptional regulator with XRE-family HTH domain